MTTLDDLAKKCGRGCSIKMVRRTLDKLKQAHTWADGRASQRADAPHLVAFSNWSSYQLGYGNRADERTGDRNTIGQDECQQSLSETAKFSTNNVYTTYDISTKEVLKDIVPLEKIVVRKEPKDLTPAYDVLTYLNLRADHAYKMMPNSVIHILTLLRQGATVQELKLIVDYKVDEWGKKPDYRRNLNNATLFRQGMFSTYLDDAVKWKKQRDSVADPFNIGLAQPKTPEELEKMKEELKKKFGRVDDQS